jgi:DNA polymerase-3 subunit gamma/tau
MWWKRFRDAMPKQPKKWKPGYLISALNILSEAEINFRAARNKRLHVELALIRLCYLNQALELTASEVAFKAIPPVALRRKKNVTV